MTSRNTSQRRFGSPLDAMIRWVLREGVCEIAPPSGVWERINERVIRDPGVKRMAWRQGVRMAAEALAVSLLEPAAAARAPGSYHSLAAADAWRGECLCWVDQYGILLRRLFVI